MGQKASLPDPNVKVQVIGCGLSRTGTASFGEALDILTGGPVYHGATQVFLREEAHVKRWLEVVKRTPIRTEADRAVVLQGLKDLLSGYTAFTDMPPILFTEELLDIFPDAKVICTVRNTDEWWDSFKPIAENTDNETFFGYAFALLPTLRYFQQWSNACRYGRFGELYYSKGHQHPHRGTYDDHMEYIKRVVPKERIQYYDVRDGWEPLCKMLDCEVPDVPFPKANDSAAAEAFFKYQLMRGAISWVGLGAGIAVSASVALGFWRRGRLGILAR